MGSYDDIIHLSRPLSQRPRMSMADRAAQFSPFAALTGHEAALEETARLTQERLILDESAKEAMNRTLLWLADHLADRPQVQITYFQPDDKKEGGAYLTAAGILKKIDLYEQILLLEDGTRIPVEQIFDVQVPESRTL